MSTQSTAQLNAFADAWEDSYASAVCSGIVGDARHAANGGYHISIQDQSSTNYSVVRPDDKAPPGTWPRDRAAAVDMSMSSTDMVTCYGRIRRVFNNRSDPRRKYVNAVNCWDGSGDAARLDFYSGSVSTASDDHKWHTHHEFRRRYVNDPEAMRAALSMYRGESVEQWMAQEGEPEMPTPVFNTGEIKTGFACDESGSVVDVSKATELAVPTTLAGAFNHWRAWLGVGADFGEARLRIATYSGGWKINTYTVDAGHERLSIGLPAGTTKITIARMKQRSDDTADAIPLSWLLEYAP